MGSEGVCFMADAIIETSWGFRKIYSQAPHVLVHKEDNFEIWRRANNSFVGFALVEGKTRTNVATSHEGLHEWLRTFGIEPGPVPTEQPGPEVEQRAFFRVDSNPAGGRVFIDNIDTGQNTLTAAIEVLPGAHKIEVKGLEGFIDTQQTLTVQAGQTNSITIEMIPKTAFPPPEEPAPAPDPREEFKTPLNALVTALLGTEPEILRAWDDLMFWLTDTFGTEFPAFYRDEITGEIKKQDTGKKVIFLVSMSAPIGAAQTAIQTTVINMTASDILSLGLRDPKGLASLVKGLTKEQVSQLFARLVTQPSGRDAIQTIQRVVLDQTAKISVKQAATLAGGGILGLYSLAHTLNFIGFLGEEAIQTAGIGVFELVSNKVWPEAARALDDYRKTVDAIAFTVDGLLQIPVLNIFLAQWWPHTKRAAYEQIDAYDKTIKDGLTQAETGAISISTKPPNATVWINDVQHPWKTNTVIDKLVPGDYKIRLELTEHKTHEETVKVETDKTAAVEHDFEPIPGEITPRAGRIQWETEDAKTGATIGASWYIDGRLEDQYATSGTIDMVPGAYELRWTAPGYKDYEDTIVVEEQVTTKLIVKMEKIEEPPEPVPSVTCETLGFHTNKPEDGQEYEQIPTRGLLCWGLKEPTKGKLEVNSNIQAKILIGGTDTGKKTPASFDLTQGIYTVTLQAEDHIGRSTTTLIKPGETSVVFLELHATDVPPPKQRLARVSIQSEPSGAKITVNGVWTKKYTPDSVLLEAGDYEISLTKSGFQTWRTPLRLVEES